MIERFVRTCRAASVRAGIWALSLAAAAAAVAPLWAPAPAGAALLDRDELSRIEGRVQQVAVRVGPAVVALTHKAAGKQEGMASGTGTIVTPDGLIVTAAHVVEGADRVDV
ncbi:MAG: hypothetical protein FJ275_08030, partial [Planctomycetes bacterium]|nr:hypothetical protein [Planctomycetota bacterium]